MVLTKTEPGKMTKNDSLITREACSCSQHLQAHEPNWNLHADWKSSNTVFSPAALAFNARNNIRENVEVNNQ